MPKQKTHSGAKDRFRVTRNGKVVHAGQNRNHFFEKKTSQHKRRIRRQGSLTGGDRRQIIKLLGGR